MEIIARIHTDLPEKFGVPRQSGLVPSLTGEIVFEPPYRVKEAFRGLEGYSHLWLIWDVSLSHTGKWSPTVRPPRLGGNTRMGVFATRSPFRPNPIGLSCVKIESIDFDTPSGVVITVSGADLVDGTPIYDIKPYVAYTDAHPDARSGFAVDTPELLKVVIPDELIPLIPPGKSDALRGVLAADPRPSYQSDGREYGLSFAGRNVKFTVTGDTAVVTAIE